MKHRSWLVGVATLALLVSACGGDDGGSSDTTAQAAATTAATGATDAPSSETTAATSDTTASATATTAASGEEDAGEAQDGGTVTIGQVSPLRSLDPAVVALSNGEMQALYGRLIGYDPEAGEYVGETVEEFSANADSSVWTIKLRDGITFSDGTPYDAAAVVTNMDRFADPERRSPAFGMMATWVSSVKAVDDLTVEFTLTKPLASFPFILANYPTFIAAPSYLAAVDGGDATATPIGAGPFTLDTFLPGEEISFVRNDTYFAGPPHLDGLKFVYIPGGPATYDSFQTGALQAAIVNDKPTVGKALEDDVPHYTSFSDIYNTLLINNRPASDPAGSVLSDVRLRQAMAYTFDITVWNDRVNQGLGDDSPVLFPETSPLFPDGSQWFDAALEANPYDPEKAKALVDEVKAEGNWDGTIKFVCSSNPAQVNMPVAVKAMLEPVGFKVEVDNSLDQGALINAVIVNPDYDFACWGISVPDYDPVPYLYTYLYGGGFNNFGQFSDPTMDAVLDKLREASGHDEVQAALVEFQQVWNETVPSIYAGSGTFATIYSDDLHDVIHGGTGPNFSKAWLSS